LAIGCSLQVFQQATGINTLMYYTATIVSMAGIGTTSASSAIWTSAVITAAYLAACCAGVLLVERLGRRRLLLTSLLGVVFSLVLIAVGFQLASSHSPPAAAGNSSSSSSCDSWTTCSACLEGDGCGFCSSGNLICHRRLFQPHILLLLLFCCLRGPMRRIFVVQAPTIKSFPSVCAPKFS
jgi:SP family myo-inositol transporter-like MFS transporter 13